MKFSNKIKNIQAKDTDLKASKFQKYKIPII